MDGNNLRRSNWIKIRVSDAERKLITEKADLAGCTVAQLVRQSLHRVKTWTIKDKEIERERIREIRRIGQNLNQLAKWCNTYKAAADAAQVILLLVKIEQALQQFLFAAKMTQTKAKDAH